MGVVWGVAFGPEILYKKVGNYANALYCKHLP